jgi:outer membrane receptor for ferric coprogen and ferric-rhodotorulic acid
MTTKAGMEVIQMNDDRTTFFAQGDTVLALTYDGATDAAFEYRTTYALMVHALSPSP